MGAGSFDYVPDWIVRSLVSYWWGICDAARQHSGRNPACGLGQSSV